jgi:hypothetical protein
MIQHYSDHAANERTFLAWVRTGRGCLFDETGANETAGFDLREYTNQIWHGYVPSLAAGTSHRGRTSSSAKAKRDVASGQRLSRTWKQRRNRPRARPPARGTEWDRLSSAKSVDE